METKDVLSNQLDCAPATHPSNLGVDPVDTNLHSPERRLIELKIAHADLDALIDLAGAASPLDELTLRRLKKRRLGLRDEISRLERDLNPNEPA